MSDINKIKERLFSVIPTSSFHMIEFLKLADIKLVEKETQTAAITCDVRPTLLLNKSFIETYCEKDEHLFMLIMHELYHIILGHTHLFKKTSLIDNIAFDAIINAILCRSFPGEEYISFFTSLNSQNGFPSCILRPIGKNTPKKFISILKNLYKTNTGTYYEVYKCIIEELKETLSLKNNKYVLLGNHDNNCCNNNPIIKKLVNDIISKWPRELLINGKDLGGKIEDKLIEFSKVKRTNQIKMKRLLAKSGVNTSNVSIKKKSLRFIQSEATLLSPDYKDRTLLTKSIIYKKPLIYNSTLLNSKIDNEDNVLTLIYLDVSGSVINDINNFASLLLKPYKNKQCLLFAFSTIVVPISYKEFKEGKYKSTGGTSLDCIFKHYFSLPKKMQTKKILILTDGDTGKVSNNLYEKIKDKKLEIYCGLFGEYKKDDLLNITKYFEEF